MPIAMRPRIFFIIITVLTLLSACAKEDHVDYNLYPAQEDIILRNIAYGPEERHKMDIFLPAGRSPEKTKLLVYIHGGDWIAGDKDDLPVNEDNFNELKEFFPDVALASVNYRLASSPQYQYPAAELDIDAALAFIQDKLNHFQLQQELILVGGSAGANLAALHLLKSTSSEQISKCILISGSYDLEDMYESGSLEMQNVLKQYLGGTPTQASQTYFAASPINFIHPSATKTKILVLHGTNDAITPLDRTVRFVDKLEENGSPISKYYYRGGHEIPTEAMNEVLTKVNQFINE